MARNEFVVDLTDNRICEPNITRSGNVVSVELKTEHSKVELVMDMADFAALVAESSLILNKKKGVA